MLIVFYPSNVSPYPSASPMAVRRVDPKDYTKWDGLVIKLGPVGFSVNWRRRT
jgi:ABC-type sulfate transport system substrate-binding protein